MNKILLLIFYLLCGCSDKSQQSSDVLIVGTSPDNRPFEFIENGVLVGFDIDLINAIASKIGKKIIIKNISFQGLVPALHSREIDLLIAGISATEDRKTDVLFSVPYTESSMILLSNNDFVIAKLDDLKHKIIGAQMSSSLYQKAKEMKKQIPELSIRALNSNLLLVNELILRNIDVLITETSQVKQLLQNHKNLNQFEIQGSKSLFSIAYSKNNDKNHGLVQQIDQAIEQLKKDGTIAILEKKWLN